LRPTHASRAVSNCLQSLLPLLTFFLLRTGVENDIGWSTYNEASTPEKSGASVSGRLVLVATGTSAVALSTIWISPAVTTLGVCSSIFTATSLLLVEQVLSTYRHDEPTVTSINGLLQRRAPIAVRDGPIAWTTLRDMATVVGVVCFAVSLSTEKFRNDGMTYRHDLGLWEKWGTKWKTNLPWWTVGRAIFGVLIETAYALLLLNLVSGPPSRGKWLFQISLIFVKFAVAKAICSLSWQQLPMEAETFFLLARSSCKMNLLETTHRPRTRDTRPKGGTIRCSFPAITKWPFLISNPDPHTC
jgi:hypothetical protein